MSSKKIPNFAGNKNDAENIVFRIAGRKKTMVRLFVRRREEIRNAQQMNDRYWNKKSQRVCETVLNTKLK